jgi:hypothetical protein
VLPLASVARAKRQPRTAVAAANRGAAIAAMRAWQLVGTQKCWALVASEACIDSCMNR